jgi:hypothetical protein
MRFSPTTPSFVEAFSLYMWRPQGREQVLA